jgi:uncharacterized membrane protein
MPLLSRIAPPVLRLHRFLLRTSFYALTLCTLICFAFLLARVHMSGERRYGFLVWNLFLAWVPYWCSQAVLWLCDTRWDGGRRLAERPSRAVIIALSAMWLAFFPNAPYIITDFKHFFDAPTLAWWYDIGLIMTFAWTGCFLGVASLRIMQSLVAHRFGAIRSWIFAIATMGLSGLGIYIGRFLRLNSWDLLVRPQTALGHIGRTIVDPLSHPRTIGVTLMFAAILLACYVTFASMQTPISVNERDRDDVIR